VFSPPKKQRNKGTPRYLLIITKDLLDRHFLSFFLCFFVSYFRLSFFLSFFARETPTCGVMYNTPLGPLVAIIKAVTYCNILQHIHSVFGIKRSHAKDRNIFVHVLLYVAFAKSCANSPRFGIRFILINQILLRALYQTSGNFCNPLQHTATHCNTFQHTATCCPAI